MRHHPDDKKWILEQLYKLPVGLRDKAVKGYSKVYCEVYDATPLLHQKDCEARRAANTRLRHYVAAVTKKAPHEAGQR